MTDDPFQMPDINSAKRESIRILIDFYIRNQVQKTDGQGKIESAFNDVAIAVTTAKDAPSPDSASYLIDRLMDALREIDTPPRILNSYLNRIIDDPSMPHTIVDAAIEFQDKLIEGTWEMRAERDELQEEFAHLMIDPQP